MFSVTKEALPEEGKPLPPISEEKKGFIWSDNCQEGYYQKKNNK